MADPILHATCVALKRGDADWSGILLRGPSGCGKSDLALRVINEMGPEGARLVADDYVCVCGSDAPVEVRAPRATFGKLEVRGLGIVELPALERVNVKLAFDLVDAANVPRLPEPRWLDMGHDSERAKIPLFALAPFESSAVAKVIATFDTLETRLGRQ